MHFKISGYLRLFIVLAVFLIGLLVLIWVRSGDDRADYGLACYGENQTLGTCDLPKSPYLLLTSDTHISLSQGRWPETTALFGRFLDSISSQPPEILFINGDVIDNFDGQKAGDMDYWRAEWGVYEKMSEKYKSIKFRQSYGPGHDWLNRDQLRMLEEEIGPAKGRFSWRGIHFIWFTFGQAAFDHDNQKHANVLHGLDYTWLDRELTASSKAVLLFHVPVRTEEAYRHGQWPNKMNLTIDPRDRLYQVIDKHRGRLLAIFNGHIHKAIQSEYKGVPVYLCPFFDKGGFCSFETTDGAVSVTRYHFVSEK